MSYLGLTPSEYSSGARQRRGPITKTGNSHVRRILVESAWHYRHPPQVGEALRKRRAGQPGWAVLATTLPMQVDVRDHRIILHEVTTNVEEDDGGQRERGPVGAAPQASSGG